MLEVSCTYACLSVTARERRTRPRGCGTPRTSRRPNPPLVDSPEMDDGMLPMLSNDIAVYGWL
jgi:hypothetical protein